MAVSTVALSTAVAAYAAAAGWRLPSMLLVTSVALLIAQLPVASRMTLAKPLGIWGMYLFLAAVGASADLGALMQAGALGLSRISAWSALPLRSVPSGRSETSAAMASDAEAASATAANSEMSLRACTDVPLDGQGPLRHEERRSLPAASRQPRPAPCWSALWAKVQRLRPLAALTR